MPPPDEFRDGVPAAYAAVLRAGETTVTVNDLQFVSENPVVVSVRLDDACEAGGAIRREGAFRARIPGAARGSGGDLELDCTIRAVHATGDGFVAVAVAGERQKRYPFVASREAFAHFVSAWETGTLAKAEWTHAAHIAMGACYAVRYGGRALDAMREGILRYNVASGTANTETSGYHETLTRFWVGVLAQFNRGVTDEWLAARRSVERFGEERDLYTLFYRFDVVRSTEARRRWVAPDFGDGAMGNEA